MADEKSASKNNTLYREALLEHAKRPRHQGRLEAPQFSASASNPLCGDELEITMRLAEGKIEALGFTVRGCMIVQAAASMISEAVAGISLQSAHRLGAEFRAAMERPRATMEGRREVLPEDPREVMEDPREDLPEGLESLQPLIAVRRHRSRIRCALLPWDALDACGAESEED